MKEEYCEGFYVSYFCIVIGECLVVLRKWWVLSRAQSSDYQADYILQSII